MTQAADDTPAVPRTLRVRGPVAIVDADGRSHPVAGAQPQTVLALLALADRPVPRDVIADVLWGDRLSDHWKGAVRGVVAKVRAALVDAGLPPEVVTSGGTISLSLPDGWASDVARSTELLDSAGAAERAADPARALADARRALAVLGPGPFLPHADGEWARLTRDRVDAGAREAATIVVRSLIALGRHGEAARAAEAAIAEDPLDEAAHHLLVSTLLADGRSVEARQAYDRLVVMLDDELGISPSEATTALVAAPPTTRPSAQPRDPARWPRRADDLAFVGRESEIDVLDETWAEVAASGRPALVVLDGPAGMGKTRLAAHLCERLSGDGAAVLWGRCRDGSGVAFEPVAEALGSEEWDRAARGAPDDGLARGALFRSVAETVRRLAQRPSVWVVDDLQWATEDTLHLVEAVLDSVARPILVVATVRRPPASVLSTLARLGRILPSTTLELTGFGETDLLALVRNDETGRDAAALERAQTLLERTAGHPLLVSEIARDGRRQGRPLDAGRVPASVRDWVGRRAAALPDPLSARLDLAATIGLEVDLELLARCSSDPVEVVLDQCEGLVDQGLLVELGPGRFAFAHQITHEVIYARLGASRRALLHRRVAAALETGSDGPGTASERAHHHARAGHGARGQAARHGLAAGQESLARSAWALAAGQLAAAGDHAVDDPALRAEILVASARALHGLWNLAPAADAAREALDLARQHDRPTVLAAAVLLLVGRAGRGVAVDMSDEERISLLREALAALGPRAEDDASRRGLLAQVEIELALALLLTDADGERQATARRPLTRVRAEVHPAPDDLALALLGARLASLDPSCAADRLADLDEVLALSPGSLDPVLRIRALHYRSEDRLVQGDREGALADLARGRALADRHAHPYWQWASRTWEALWATIDGELDRAEALAEAAAGRQAAGREAGACYGVNLVAIRTLQGRAEEVVDLVAAAAESFPQIPCYRAVLAWCCADAGDVEQARRALDHFASSGFANVPDDTNRALSLAVLADTCAALGDVDAARALLPLLEPYREHHVVLNCYGGGGAYWGPAAHHLAALAALTDHPSAAALLTIAEERARALGAPLALAGVRTLRSRVDAPRS